MNEILRNINEKKVEILDELQDLQRQTDKMCEAFGYTMLTSDIAAKVAQLRVWTMEVFTQIQKLENGRD